MQMEYILSIFPSQMKTNQSEQSTWHHAPMETSGTIDSP